MKKFTAFLLAAALLCLCCACGASQGSSGGEADSRSAADIWSALQEKIDMENLPAMTELDADGLSSFYGLTDAEVESFVCQFPLINVSATEILIAKCVPGQEAAVKAGAEKRQADLLNTWGSYLPDQLELVENYHLVQNGQWLLFVVAEQADSIESAFMEVTNAK